MRSRSPPLQGRGAAALDAGNDFQTDFQPHSTNNSRCLVVAALGFAALLVKEVEHEGADVVATEGAARR